MSYWTHNIFLLLKVDMFQPNPVLTHLGVFCVWLFATLGFGTEMVVYILCWEYCKSEKTIIKWLASLRTTHGWSVVCAVATTTKTISPSSLCGPSYVVTSFDYCYSMFLFKVSTAAEDFILSINFEYDLLLFISYPYKLKNIVLIETWVY